MIFPSYKKYINHIVLLALLLAMAGIIWYGVLPLKQDIYNKMRGIQEFYVRMENRDKQVARLPELKTQYDTIVENEKILSVLISEDQIVDFVKTLEGLANETHVEMSITSKDNGQIVEPKKAIPKSGQSGSGDTGDTPDSSNAQTKQKTVDILNDASFNRYLYLNIQVRGQYEDIIVFLRKMETLPVALDVVGVDMKKGEVKDAAPVQANSGNPFLVSGDNAQTAAAQPPVAAKDVYEATFNVLVYVNKQN